MESLSFYASKPLQTIGFAFVVQLAQIKPFWRRVKPKEAKTARPKLHTDKYIVMEDFMQDHIHKRISTNDNTQPAHKTVVIDGLAGQLRRQQ